MADHLYRNWIVYVLMIGFIWFLASVHRKAWREERERQEQEKLQENSQKNIKK